MSRSETSTAASRKDFSEYVAQLQLHMARQAQNPVARSKAKDSHSRTGLLLQTQADFEKIVSRQYF
ncbi:MAG: hypothetical protein AAGF01_32460 [Cyanobacteria bacterium P01_G01_bin.38]